MKAKKLIATLAMAGVITAGSAGAAFAADGSTPGNGQPPAGQAAGRHPGARRHLLQEAMKVVADTLGVSTQDLRTALKGGQSISEYATSLGKNPQDVVTALVNAANTHIDQAVADGKLDATKAAEIKAKVPDRVNQLVNRKFGQHAAGAPQQPAS